MSDTNTRRQFFGSVAMAAAAATIASLAPAEPAAGLREILRYSYVTDSWTRVRMFQLRAGDVFQLGELGVFRAHSDPIREPDGGWAIHTDCRIDPATNLWV